MTSWNHWEKRVECSITLRNNSAFALQNAVLKEAPILLIIRTDQSRTYRIMAIPGNPQLSKNPHPHKYKVLSLLPEPVQAHKSAQMGPSSMGVQEPAPPCPQGETGHRHLSHSAERSAPGQDRGMKLAGSRCWLHIQAPDLTGVYLTG